MAEPSDKVSKFTPYVLAIFTFIVSLLTYGVNDIRTKIDTLDSKVFTHLTNANIHIPRESVVSKDEWAVYQAMRDKQMADVKIDLSEIKAMLRQNIVAKK